MNEYDSGSISTPTNHRKAFFAVPRRDGAKVRMRQRCVQQTAFVVCHLKDLVPKTVPRRMPQRDGQPNAPAALHRRAHRAKRGRFRDERAVPTDCYANGRRIGTDR